MSDGNGGIRSLRPALGPPRFVTDGDAEDVGRSLDFVKDMTVERARLGALYRFPQGNKGARPSGEPVTLPPDDALEAMGRDRGIIRGIGESSADYAERLVHYLSERYRQGSPFALMQVLRAYVRGGSSFRTVDASGNYCSVDADGVETFQLGGTWNWPDLVAGEWSKFWVIIYPNQVFTGIQWGATHQWGDGSRWGGSISLSQSYTIRHIVRDWKPAGTVCDKIIISADPTRFDPASPEATPHRVPTAIYLLGSS